MGLLTPSISEDDFVKLIVPSFSGGLANRLMLKNAFHEELVLYQRKSRQARHPSSKTVLIFGDSFMSGLSDFWSYSFTKTTCSHHNWGEPPLHLIDKTKADVVIFLMIERGLDQPLKLNGDKIKHCP
jgi:hypothetical protein